VVGSPSATADPVSIPAINLVFDETKNPGKTTVSSSLDEMMSCPGSPENPKVLGRKASCDITFFMQGFKESQPVLVNFMDDDIVVSDTLTAEAKEVSPGTVVLTATFVSADPPVGLTGDNVQEMQEIAGPVNIDISSFGLPLKFITVINDADELPEPTPEPAPYVLLGTGCFALSIIGWRRQRAGVGSVVIGLLRVTRRGRELRASASLAPCCPVSPATSRSIETG
jgi:hypothetical protein